MWGVEEKVCLGVESGGQVWMAREGVWGMSVRVSVCVCVESGGKVRCRESGRKWMAREGVCGG